MWPGWASLVLAEKPYACKIQSWKATLRSTIHLVICSEPQLKYQSLCLHVNERLNNKRRKSKKLGSKNIKVEMCVHSASRTYPYQNTILLSILGDAMQNFSLSISLVAHSVKDLLLLHRNVRPQCDHDQLPAWIFRGKFLILVIRVTRLTRIIRVNGLLKRLRKSLGWLYRNGKKVFWHWEWHGLFSLVATISME